MSTRKRLRAEQAVDQRPEQLGVAPGKEAVTNQIQGVSQIRIAVVVVHLALAEPVAPSFVSLARLVNGKVLGVDPVRFEFLPHRVPLEPVARDLGEHEPARGQVLARMLGAEVEILPGDARRAVDPQAVAARLGVTIALGTDWMPTGSMNELRELACADSFNATYLDPSKLKYDVGEELATKAGADRSVIASGLAPNGDVALLGLGRTPDTILYALGDDEARRRLFELPIAGGEPVEVRRADLRLAERTQFAVAEVVGEDEDEIDRLFELAKSDAIEKFR